MTATSRAQLESERDFLLRSIFDLWDQHESGELVTERYEALNAEYFAKTAAVLAQLREVEDAERRRRRRPWKLLLLAAVAVAVVVLLLAAARDRQPGATISGNDQAGITSAAAERRALAAAVESRPDDVDTRLAYARSLLAAGDAAEAVKEFDEVVRLDPANAEAKAYAGWIVYLAGLADEGLRRVDAAITVQSDYADAHFFRGMILLRGKQDPVGAAESFRTYLELSPPDSPMRREVEGVLASIDTVTTTTVP